MAEGHEIRAEIDTETVRGLLLVNGGGAVALLTLLASIVEKPELATLARAAIWAVFIFQIGLATAVVHNRFRRLCSLEYAKNPGNRKHCSLLGYQFREPCICQWSTAFMWASIGAFIVAGVVVLLAALQVVGK